MNDQAQVSYFDRKRQVQLLNLPEELLEQVIWMYYEEMNLVLSECDLADDYGLLPGRSSFSKPSCTGMPSLALEQACRLLRKISIVVRERCFDGTLNIVAVNFRNVGGFCSVNRFEWLRSRLVTMKIDPGIIAREDILCYQRPSPDWDLLVNSCPMLKCFEFYSTFELAYKNGLQQNDFPNTQGGYLSLVYDAVQSKFDQNSAFQMANNCMFDLGAAFEKAARESFVVRYVQQQHYVDGLSSGEYLLVISDRIDGTGRWHEWLACVTIYAVAFYKCPMLSPLVLENKNPKHVYRGLEYLKVLAWDWVSSRNAG